MATLIFYIDDGREIAVPVDGRIKVGSIEGNDVLVEDAGVSPRHAEITHTPAGGYHLRDLGSESGTTVNGERVASRDLQHGDEISFGRLRGKFFLHLAGDDVKSEDEAEKKLKELRNAYRETFTKHTTLLGVVTSLANQERQKLASLDRMQTDTLNLETRIANARGILQHLEESITKAAATINQSEAEHQEIRGKVDKQTLELDQLNQSVAKFENEKLGLEQSLWELAEKRKESETRRDQADAEASKIREEHQKLSAEIAPLTQKQSELLASILEQETKTASLIKTQEDISKRNSDEAEKLERITQECQNLEQNVAVLTSNETKARETIGQMELQQTTLTKVLREHGENISRAGITLAELMEKHTLTKSETDALRAEKEHCDTEKSRLSGELTRLQSSVDDMEARQTAGLELIRQRQDQVRLAHESLDEIRAAHQAAIQSHTQSFSALLAQQQQELAALKSDESKTRDSVGQMEKQLAVLKTTLREREEKITRADTIQSGLLEKHSQTESDIVALRTAKEEHNIELAKLGVELANLQSAVSEASSNHSAGLVLLRQQQDQVRSASESLAAIKAAHQSEIESQVQTLNIMLERLLAAEARLKESNAKNEILAQQNLKLDDVLAQIQKADVKRTQLTADNLQLEDQTAKLNSNLTQRHRELESATEQLTRLRVDESALLKIIQTIQENAHTEQQRFDQSLKTHAQIIQQSEAKHQELESTLESLRGQINKLEAYLTSLEVWKDDISQQYNRLADMPKDSPDALKLWREIHKQKDDIAAVLPAQTGIKPRFNTQVQVVPRGQRPA